MYTLCLCEKLWPKQSFSDLEYNHHYGNWISQVELRFKDKRLVMGLVIGEQCHSLGCARRTLTPSNLPLVKSLQWASSDRSSIISGSTGLALCSQIKSIELASMTSIGCLIVQCRPMLRWWDACHHHAPKHPKWAYSSAGIHSWWCNCQRHMPSNSSAMAIPSSGRSWGSCSRSQILAVSGRC